MSTTTHAAQDGDVVTPEPFAVLPGETAPEVIREHYCEHGLVAVQLFGQAELHALRGMVRALLARKAPSHPRLQVFAASDTPVPGLDSANPYGVYKVVNTPLAGDDWFALTVDRKILGVVTELIGPDVNFHMGFLRLRPTGLRVQEGWHRDFDTDQHSNPGLVTALIYVDDMTAEAGATQVVPGSHRHALAPDGVTTVPLRAPEPAERVDVAVPAGTVVFLDCLTVHRACTNRTPVNRTIILHEYKRADAIEVEPNDAAFGDLPLARRGSTTAPWFAQPPRPWGAGS